MFNSTFKMLQCRVFEKMFATDILFCGSQISNQMLKQIAILLTINFPHNPFHAIRPFLSMPLQNITKLEAF